MKIYIYRLEEGLNELIQDYDAESLDLVTDQDREVKFMSPVHIRVSINRVSSQYFFHVFVEATAIFICDRCLEEFSMALKDDFQLVYTTERSYPLDGDEELGIRYLNSECDVIDITEDIREATLLAIPMKVLCSEECKGICPECGINLNNESCDHRVERIDPRWDALKGKTDRNKIN